MPITGSQLAYKFALSNVLRSGTGRSNYTTPKVFVSINGTHYATARAVDAEKVVDGTLTITETNGSPSTASFMVRGFEPLPGQEVVITLGSKNTLDRQFGGTIQTVTAKYTGIPENAQFDVQCIDFSWQAKRRRVVKRYTSQSATAIAQDLVAMVPGFTSVNVADGLDTIDEISFSFDTIQSALAQVAKRIGAAPPYVDYHKDVHLSMAAAAGTNPVEITDSGSATLYDLKVPSDISQVVTRAFREGGGSNALATADAGSTSLPVETVGWYNASGGIVVSGPQRITYGGITALSGGSLVGPGASPAASPGATGKSGSGITAGTHYYAYTFVTGAGESLPSPVSATVTTGRTLGTPTPIDSITQTSVGTGPDVPVLGFVKYATTFSVDAARNGETFLGSVSSQATNGHPLDVRFGSGGSHPEVVGDYINLYRSDDNGSTWKLQQQIGPLASVPFTQVLYHDTAVTASGSAPVSGGTTISQAALTGIAAGPSGTTSRKLYRTAAGAAQLKLLATIADNTTLTYTDNAADGTLGANVPTSDTSGLTQPTGQVLAGSTTLLLAGASAFSASGGWAVIGNGQQAIRYTGISTNTLTGIPASGTGAIVSTVAYNSSVTPAPTLNGIPASGDGAILYTITKGDPVNLLVQADDLTAQGIVAALIGGGDDGVIEDYEADGRISETEATARATAALEANGDIDVRASGVSIDNNMRAGRTLPVDITAPTTVDADFTLQRVTTSNFQTAIFPTRTFEAANESFGLPDLIRILRRVTK